jgi:hypothetical protein
MLGLHVRVWHAPVARHLPLLEAAGCSKEILKLLPKAIKGCKPCTDYAEQPPRPMIRATMARFFNHMCQADGFVLNGVSYALVIDECFCYKQAAQLKDHTFDTWFSFFWANWFRFFGPMHYLTVDQEGALAGTECGTLCDKYNISRFWLEAIQQKE